MKLATFTESHRRRIGIIDGTHMLDLAAAVPHLPQSMVSFLRAGPTALADARAALANPAARRIPLGQVRLEAPVPRPGKVLAIEIGRAHV